MAERELVVVLFRGGVPVMAACAKCQRKFFTPDTYPLRDSVAAHEYLADKFDRHECENKDDQKRKRRQPSAPNESKPTMDAEHANLSTVRAASPLGEWR